ncbi:MAG: Bax inhibitor-1 family protein [Planctomycetota bacterium]
MDNYGNPYATSSDNYVAEVAERSERVAFIQRTYLHLGAAIIALVILECMLFSMIGSDAILQALAPILRGWGWLVFLGGFMVVSTVADYWARNSTSKGMQYAGLSLYVVAEAVLLLPLLAFANKMDGNIAINAGIITAIVFGGLTAMVFITGTDFSGLGKFLWVGSLAAFAVIAAGFVMGFSLGIFFCGAMVLLASGYILYQTSGVMRHYQTDQHVAASLALFASVALLFWYVLRILIALQND